MKFSVNLAHEVQLQFRATTSDNLQLRRSTAFDPVQLGDELEQQNPQCQTEKDVMMWAGRFQQVSHGGLKEEFSIGQEQGGKAKAALCGLTEAALLKCKGDWRRVVLHL